MFESQLKQLNPDKKNITYDISNLYDYIDSLTDLSCMMYVALQHVHSDPHSPYHFCRAHA